MKNLKTLLFISLLLLSSMVTLYNMPKAKAPDPDTVYIELPSASLPMQILFDSIRNCTWVVLMGRTNLPQYIGGVAKVDVVTKAVAIYQMTETVFGDGYELLVPSRIGLDANGDIWIGGSFWKTPAIPPSRICPSLMRFHPETGLYDPVFRINGVPNDFNSYGNYMLISGGNKITMIDINTLEQTEIGCGANRAKLYNDELWMTAGSLVYSYNFTSEQITNWIEGFDNACGIEVDETKVYVADNKHWNPEAYDKIGIIDKATFNITWVTTGIVMEGRVGVQEVMKDKDGYLWWLDASMQMGIIDTFTHTIINEVYPKVEWCFFMTEVPNGSIWFSAQGSAYVGITHPPDTPRYDITKDYKIDMKDIANVARLFMVKSTDLNWIPICDMNLDNKIDMRDIATVAIHFGEIVE